MKGCRIRPAIRRVRAPGIVVAAALLAAGCGGERPGSATPRRVAFQYRVRGRTGNEVVNMYAATRAGALRGAALRARPLVYVPDARTGEVAEIDPVSLTVVRSLHTGRTPQHVVPAGDMTRLWVTDDEGDSLTPIDPVTGVAGAPVAVDDPYNLYFTPDGKQAIVLARERQRLEFRDPASMRLEESVRVRCRGLDHLEFTVDDRYAIATCAFSGELVKVDVEQRKVLGYLDLGHTAMPQDIRSSPDGSEFYVADMLQDGVHVIDPAAFRTIRFMTMGKGTHGIIVGRGGARFYITNRGWHRIPGGRRGGGSISVLDPVRGEVVATWHIPEGGSPDIGGVTADGRQLWVSGPYDGEVYVIDTSDGRLIRRIPLGLQPHGLCVWPQPGRFSVGHTGNMR